MNATLIGQIWYGEIGVEINTEARARFGISTHRGLNSFLIVRWGPIMAWIMWRSGSSHFHLTLQAILQGWISGLRLGGSPTVWLVKCEPGYVRLLTWPLELWIFHVNGPPVLDVS